jgi:Flp pilus assembly protein TadG
MTIQPARKREAGQALPLLALALIALLGFAALALDGGNLYTEQRRAQAAADNAVLAAAYQEMRGATGNDALATAAFANAAQNGYVSDVSGTPHTTVVFHLPPVDGAYTRSTQYMEVVITQTVDTALAHLVYRQNPIPLTVIAIAHGSPSRPPMSGYALAAMEPGCTGSNGTIYMEGNGGGSGGGTFLTGGGAFVNSSCGDALNMTGSHDGLITDVISDEIKVVGGVAGGWTPCSSSPPPASENCNFYPTPITGVPPVPQDPLQGTPAGTPPPCGPPQTFQSGGTIYPGSYQNQNLALGNNDPPLILSPGIYCLTGSTLSSNGGIVTGTGVLIYLTDAAATINFSGNGTLNLTAPLAGDANGCTGTADTSHDICKYLGIVVYKVTGTNLCLDNAPEIVFTGNGSMNVHGLVYAPYSLVKYGGNGNLNMAGQTIAGCVKFNGNGSITITYNPNDTYSPPPWVRLDQ